MYSFRTGFGWLRSIINGDDVGLRLVFQVAWRLPRINTLSTKVEARSECAIAAQPQVAEVRAYSA
jgi:hypothetical protein